MALRHFGLGRILDGGGLSGSQADLGDYTALLARLKEMIGWDDSARWPASALPGIGPFDRRVIAVGGVVFAVLMALSDRYGFDRDELYFLDCARHLQASYVDQPVLGPLLAWVSLKLFGVSLPGLRVWPSLAAWATVVVAGLTAREFGGGRRAQVLAAVGPVPVLLGTDHLANTTPYELLAWAGLALVVVRIGRTGDCRWWLAGGLVAGPWIAGQLLITALSLAGVSVVGLWCLSRSRRPLWRALAWAYALLFVLFALTAGAKIYYLAAAYVYLLAAGAVAIEGWLHARPGRLRNLVLVTAVLTAVTLPLALPVFPLAGLGRTFAKANPNTLETIGWPQLVHTVDVVWTSLPPSQRASAVIFTDNYGEAGAIDELGRGMGLPAAVSRQNSEWWWGPGNPHATTIVAVAPGPVGGGTGYGFYLLQFFAHVRVAATLSNPYGLRNQEWDGHVYICTGPLQPWAQTWPQLRQYS